MRPLHVTILLFMFTLSGCELSEDVQIDGEISPTESMILHELMNRVEEKYNEKE